VAYLHGPYERSPVHGEIKIFIVTSVVIRHFFILPGAPRDCADFCGPTAVSRFNSHPDIVMATRELMELINIWTEIHAIIPDKYSV